MSEKRMNAAAKLEMIAPPVAAHEAKRRSLLRAMFDAVDEEDMDAIVKAQVAKARAGDLKSAKYLTDMVQAESAGGSTVYMQQAIVAGHDQALFVSDLRKRAAAVIAVEGPMKTGELTRHIGCSMVQIEEAIGGFPWFEKEPDGWHLSNEGRNELLVVNRIDNPSVPKNLKKKETA
jgi:hypothetical protein